jgi:hypothetical protein
VTSEPDFPLAGGCACGAVRYELLADPLELHVCHCTDCQRVSGSAFVMSMVTTRSSIELRRGEPTVCDFGTPAGIHRREQRCAGCGSRLWSEPNGLPDLLTLRPGTLDERGWLRPIAHIWTRSAQPWVEIPTGVLRYEGNPADPLELVRAWRARVRA